MAKGSRGRRGIASRQCRPTPYPLSSYKEKEDMQQMNCTKVIKKDWEDATCSVCMECPHNAVLLLCSSHNKGCRPYMCGTSFRYSNCLDQYKKACTKATSSCTNLFHGSHNNQVIDPCPGQSVDNFGAGELLCPLCRGQVKGWTVVEPAREHLNAKKRSCMQENCTFAGTFKELRKHVRADHPSAKPREADPTLEQKWRRMERERERVDMMSTITTSTPGAVFSGDYVMEGRHYEVDSFEEEVLWNEGMEVGIESLDNRNFMDLFLLVQAYGSAGSNRGLGNLEGFDFSDPDSIDHHDDNSSEDDGNSGTSLAVRLRRRARILFGDSRRRRRHREEAEQGRR